jgi:hypothetical protein
MKMLTSANILINLILWVIALGIGYGVLRILVAQCEPESATPFIVAPICVFVSYFAFRPFIMAGVTRSFTMPGKSAWRK